jgi:hypothetical protein
MKQKKSVMKHIQTFVFLHHHRISIVQILNTDASEYFRLIRIILMVIMTALDVNQNEKRISNCGNRIFDFLYAQYKEKEFKKNQNTT